MRNSILTKIIFSFLFVLIIPTAIISVTNYYSSIHMLEKKVSDSFLTNLTFIANNIGRELGQWQDMSKYVIANPVIREVLMTNYTSDAEFNIALKRVDKELETYSINTNIFAYISSLVVFGNNGRNLLFGEDVSTLDLELIQKQAWLKYANASSQVEWLGIHKNYANYRTQNENVIGLTRHIKGDSHYEDLGVLYLAFRPQYFFNLLGNLNLQEDSWLYIVDNHDQIVFDSSLKLTGEQYGKMNSIREQPNQRYIVEKNEDGEKILLAYTPIQNFEWWAVQTIPYNTLMESNKGILMNTLVVFLVSFILAAIIWYFVSSNIVRPIRKLTETMKSVQEGNLDARAHIERSDEIGLMNQHFNYMIDRIQELFQSNAEEQEKKRQAEIRALQAQINPHFLYNTLNTIRWMAIIQKAGPIQDVIEVLGRLLKSKFKSDGPFISIEEEISNLKDYIYIQQLRYNHKFEVRYDIPSKDVLAHRCIQFILQPIVENAIFHGIQPKEGPGEIVISVEQRKEQMVIRVRDNGMGMTEKEIYDTMWNISTTNGIGLGNVAERLKLTYGEQYGLTIQSEVGAFTEIEMIFPREDLD